MCLVKQERGDEECHVAIRFLISKCKGLPALRAYHHVEGFCLSFADEDCHYIPCPLYSCRRVLSLIYPKRTMAEVPWEVELSPHGHSLRQVSGFGHLRETGWRGLHFLTLASREIQQKCLKEHCSCLCFSFRRGSFQRGLLSSFATRKC